MWHVTTRLHPLSVGVLQKRCCWGRRCRLLLPRHSAGSLKLWRTQKKQRHQWQRPQNGTILYIHSSSSSLRLESRTSRPLFFLLLFNLEDEAAVWLYTASTHTYSTASKFWAWRAEKTYTQQLDLVRLVTHTSFQYIVLLSVWKKNLVVLTHSFLSILLQDLFEFYEPICKTFH